jgi:transposase
MSEAVIPIRYRLRVKQRLKVVVYAKAHGVKPAGRHFGLDRKTVREWRDRHRAHGLAGLWPQYPARRRRRLAPEVVALVKLARTEHQFGAARTRIWLQRVHGVSIATQTIQRLFRDLGLNRLASRRKRRPKQLLLFEKDQPGDSVQVDVKFVRVNRQRYFQYTAIDDCTRFRVLRLYRQLNQHSSLAFFREFRAAMPFPIRKVQSDNGSELHLPSDGVAVGPHQRWYPVQVKQKDKAGRPDVDAFEAMMARSDRTKGFFVSFDYSSDALTEIDSFFRKSARVIIPLTVNEILNEQIARKLA